MSTDNPILGDNSATESYDAAYPYELTADRAACAHEPRCPAAEGVDRDAAHAIVCHPEQGWSLLCNGVVLFEDSGEILPDGNVFSAPRAELTAAALHRKVA